MDANTVHPLILIGFNFLIERRDLRGQNIRGRRDEEGAEDVHIGKRWWASLFHHILIGCKDASGDRMISNIQSYTHSTFYSLGSHVVR